MPPVSLSAVIAESNSNAFLSIIIYIKKGSPGGEPFLLASFVPIEP